MFYPHNASDQSISVFFNGRMCSVPHTDSHFDDLRAHLANPEHDHEFLENILDKPQRISRLSEGLVEVIGSTVYYKGIAAHSTLTYRLLEMLDNGENAVIWARFLERVMENPSERSRSCLYDFLNKWKAPITEDGHFIAFKRVRSDYKDIHSGKFDNSPGSIVQMPREGVNPDPDESCSRGLHVAASSYLGSFYATSTDSKVLACKVDPADVVAVPRDYGFAKMRVCRYEVLGDADESFVNNADKVSVYTPGAEAPVKENTDVTFDDDEDETTCWECGEEIPNWMSRCDDCQEEADREAEEEAEREAAEEEEHYCGECGDHPVEEEDDLCADCEADEMEQWHAQNDATNAMFDEADHIAETGLTTAGEPASDSQKQAAAAFLVIPSSPLREEPAADEGEGNGHSVARFTEDNDEDEVPSEMAFQRNGVTYTASEITEGVEKSGQRGYGRLTGIPRTTLQDWLTKIEACAD